MAAPPDPPCTITPLTVPTLPAVPACASPLPAAAANSQRAPAACLRNAVPAARVLTEHIDGQGELLPCTRIGAGPASHACLHALPIPIISLTTSTFSAPQVTRKRGRARAQGAGPRFRALRCIFLGVQGLCDSRRCALAFARAIACVVAVGRPSCARPSARV